MKKNLLKKLGVVTAALALSLSMAACGEKKTEEPAPAPTENGTEAPAENGTEAPAENDTEAPAENGTEAPADGEENLTPAE